MPKTYFSSDLHLNHNKNFCYEPRGFQSVDEMNKTIIERFNEIIKPEDTLYLLGDIMLGDAETAQSLFKQLPRCNTVIVQGNHDTNNRIQFYEKCENVFVAVGLAIPFKYGRWNFILSHYPVLVSYENQHTKRHLANLSGHTHNPDKFAMMNEGIYNVAVDAHDCYPVDIETIIADIEAYQ